MSWKEVKLGDFLEVRTSRYKYDDKSICDLKRIDKIDFSGNIYLSEKPSKTDMILIQKGDLVISGINVEKGAMAIYQGKKDIIATIHYSSYKYDRDKIDIDFLKLFLQSQEFRTAIKEQVPGGIKTEIKPKHLLPLTVCIPSDIQDQRKIVTKIGISFSKIEKLTMEQHYQLDLIKKLRQQILKDAIQGKLVLQNTDDEPASKLLKEIKAEKERLIKEKKIKKGKPLAPISEDELPFTIPKNWEWCRLGEVVNLARGRFSVRPRNDSSYFNGKYPFIQIGSLDEKGSTIYDSNQTLNERGKSVSKEFPKETIVIAIVGGTIGNLGVLGTNMCFTDSIIGIYPNKLYNQKFVLNYLRFAQPEIKMAAYQMAGQPNIKIPTLTERIFPLPPLAEQQRIVKRIDELMDLCNKLEESIIRNQEITKKIYQSALKEALQPKETKKIELLPNYCDVPKRTILAGYILNQCHTEDFGRVKFMKLVYLVEHICYLDFNSQYIKKAAGPYDENLIKEIEQKLSQMQFYQIQQDKKDNKRVHYTRLGCADELDSLFTTNFVNEKEAVNELLTKFKHSTWDQCEIIATLYAVWNNRIIQNELINDALLKQDFLDWDKNKVKYKDRLDAALDWMRNNSIIPNGYGKLIEKP